MSERVDRQVGLSRRALASLTLSCAGAWLILSGVALHVAVRDEAATLSHFLMSMHGTASLLFVAAAVTHVTLNWKTLTHYVNARVGEYARFKRELWVAILGVTGLVFLVASHALHVP